LFSAENKFRFGKPRIIRQGNDRKTQLFLLALGLKFRRHGDALLVA
jgi:hypothetical protein